MLNKKPRISRKSALSVSLEFSCDCSSWRKKDGIKQICIFQFIRKHGSINKEEFSRCPPLLFSFSYFFPFPLNFPSLSLFLLLFPLKVSNLQGLDESHFLGQFELGLQLRMESSQAVLHARVRDVKGHVKRHFVRCRLARQHILPMGTKKTKKREKRNNK
jgi:hypothetical protein